MYLFLPLLTVRCTVKKIAVNKPSKPVINLIVTVTTAVATAFLLSAFEGCTVSVIQEQLILHGKVKPKSIAGPATWCKPYDQTLDGQKRIFFIETSGEPCLKLREACSVESAARANPLLPVYVHILAEPPPGSPEKDEGPGLRRDCFTTDILEEFANVKFVYEKLGPQFEDTPLWRLYQSNRFKESQFSFQHISDAMRVAMLYKGGGIYLDMDLIVLRPLHCLSNAFGYVDVGFSCIENDVLSFDKNHTFLWFLMEEMNTMYKPNERSSIGPLGITQKFKEFCDYSSEKLYSTKLYRCRNGSSLVAFGPEAFHPIGWAERHRFFVPNFNESELAVFRSSFSVHVYGSGHGAEAPPSSLFAFLAANYCPSVYSFSIRKWKEF